VTAERLVLDASAALRFLLDQEGADQVADRLEEAGQVLAPAFQMVEVANVLWKVARSGALTAAEAWEHLEALADLVDEAVDDRELLADSLALAIELQHPVYDCLYLALARRLDAGLISFDRRLLNLFETMG
jgi:predicted nucleic acid-binding protein